MEKDFKRTPETIELNKKLEIVKIDHDYKFRKIEKKDKRSTMLRRKSMKKARNKWIRRSKLPNADKIYKGWEY